MNTGITFAANSNVSAASTSALDLLTNNVVALPKIDVKAEFDNHYAAGNSVVAFLMKHRNLDTDALQHISRVSKMKPAKLSGLVSYVAKFGAWSEIESERIIIVFEHIGYEEDYSGRTTKSGQYINPNGKGETFLTLQPIITKVYSIFRDMNMPIEINAVRFAIESEINCRRTETYNSIINGIAHDGNARQAEWSRFVRYYFDLSEQSEEYVIGVLQKFIHQIKTKLQYKQVNDHLMPVIFGNQGVGKSYFVDNILCGPMKQLIKKSDFGAITNEKNGELWQAPIIFLDEMQNVTRSDVDAIKNRITSSTVDYRPMGTNRVTSITNNATFIGTTNAGNLGQLIRDTTGNRRFAPLTFRSKRPDTEVDFDVVSLWKSIDPDNDPSARIKNELTKTQADHKYYTNVAAWFEEFAQTSVSIPSRIAVREIRETYNKWCRDNGEVPVKVMFFKNDLATYLATRNDYEIINPKNVPTLVAVQSAKMVDFAE